MPICGPKFSVCCTVISAWAVVQLGLMGVFFMIKSPALIEDVLIPEEAEESPAAFIAAMEKGYHASSTNCFIATLMYALTFIVSGWQAWLNFK